MTVKFNIVVASDLTARSDRPFDRAVQIARECGGRLILVHALDGGGAVSEIDRRRASAHQTVDQLLAGIDVPVEVIVEEGAAPQLVGTTAETSQAAMILVGPARYNNVTDFFLGTAVDYLLRNAPCPVLVAKQRPGRFYDQLIIGTDFSQISAEALGAAAALFPALPIRVIHAYQPVFPTRLDKETSHEVAESMAREELADFKALPAVAELAARCTFELVAGNTESVLASAAAQCRMPLIAIGAHGRSGFAQALLGSRASEILAALPTDILVVRRGIGAER